MTIVQSLVSRTVCIALFGSVSCIGAICTVSAQPASKSPVKQQTAASSELIDCGTDENCFIQAAGTCQKARATVSRPAKIFGLMSATATYQEIRGATNGKCTYYQRTESVDIKFTEELTRQMKESGATQQEIEQAEQDANRDADASESIDGICLFAIRDLENMLKRWRSGELSTSDWDQGECHGKMFGKATSD